jgi:3-(3-hydroxy-phenyl)propionate hydroxylase
VESTVPNFVHTTHPVTVPPLVNGREIARRPVLIAGGGPVGLAVALALASRGIAVLVVEADQTVCAGSRAICLSRRTLEILERLGALTPFQEKGLPWMGGRSFHRSDEVLHFTMPNDRDQRLAPMTNLQQYYIEQFLLDAAAKCDPNLLEVRWGTRVDGLHQGRDGVVVELATDTVSYATECDFLVACDGARSRVRQAVGLRMNGTSYEGRYVIVDIEIDLDLPTERLAWFDPPSNPGRTMLMHKQPDNIWRLDYQLHPTEDSEEMIREDKVTPVVAAHLEMIGIDRPWRLIWTSMYRAAAVSLDSYRSDRVVFAGDAAHLVPIFGVRGLNSGFDDAFNLGWKLASVIAGCSPDTILDTYSEERRRAWEVNVTSAMKSTEFMAPPSRGYELMRDAVLSLAKDHPAIATLIDPRQSAPIAYEGSRLNTVTRDEGSFNAGPRPGSPPLECPLIVNGKKCYLTSVLGSDFTLVWTGEGDLPSMVTNELHCAINRGLSVVLLTIGAARLLSGTAGQLQTLHAEVVEGRFTELYDAAPSAAYLFRPDGHVCARWRTMRPGDLSNAIDTALGCGKAERS